MAKDPAFLFYPNDWIGGTMGMTFEEKGAYMELLMTQFNRGHMTTHMIGQVVGQIWEKIQDKFVKDENGLWYNVRLEEEKVKRQNYTKSRNNNALGKNQHNKNEEKNTEKEGGHTGGHMTRHMEDENTLVNNNKNNINLQNSNLFKKPNIPSKDDVWEFFKSSGGTKEMAKSFYDKYEATGWMLNGSPVVNFRALAGRFIANWQQNDAKRNPPVQEQKQTLTKLPTYIQPKYD
jgi:uncharacterized protein YdaU (DUF1376 family)